MKCFRLTTLCCVPFLAAAGCQTSPAVTQACDVLVRIDPKPATNRYLVENDRPTAQAIARHRGRVEKYGC